ncbi:hypothetical protein [Spirillospora sp. NPDC047279]|uniref:hypothetical protein n=1 Tax=Spirillospora sp. NPDC047279 TaxID=3155478 RepID=UPI0033C1BD4E
MQFRTAGDLFECDGSKDAADGGRRAAAVNGNRMPAGVVVDCMVDDKTELAPMPEDAAGWRALVDEWRRAGIGEPLTTGRSREELLMDCVTRLGSAPDDRVAPALALGIMIMSQPFYDAPPDLPVDSVVRVLTAVDAALRDRPCEHGVHAYDAAIDDYEELMYDVVWEDFWGCHTFEGWNDLPATAARLVGAEPWTDQAEQRWRCPRNVAAFTRMAIDALRPGAAEDVLIHPPLLAREPAEHLSRRAGDVLEDYPLTDDDARVTVLDLAAELSVATEHGQCAALIVTLRTLATHHPRFAVPRVLEEAIAALETALDALPAARCAHDDDHPVLATDPEAWNPALGGPNPEDQRQDISTVSWFLTHGGRAAYEWRRRRFGGVSLDSWLCPIFLRHSARVASDEMRAGLRGLFGTGETPYLDAELLRPDGRLEIDKLTGLLKFFDWEEFDVAEASHWAARRLLSDPGGPRERLVLLVFLFWSRCRGPRMALPAPIAADVRAALRTVDPAALGSPCRHGGAPHPWDAVWDGAGDPDDVVQNARACEMAARMAINALYAPEEYEPVGLSFSFEDWNCPRHLADLAHRALSTLEPGSAADR